MALIIIDRKVHAKDLLNRQIERHSAILKMANQWASMQIGDQNKLSDLFLEKIEDVRRREVLGHQFSKQAASVSDEIRKKPKTTLHSERIFDIAKLLDLL